jgi:hypothetical protein
MNPVDASLYAAIAAAAGATAAAVNKGLEYLITRARQRASEGTGAPSLEQVHHRVVRIDDVVTRTDKDGLPLVYTPRSVGDNVLGATEVLRDIDLTVKQSERTITSLLNEATAILAAIRETHLDVKEVHGELRAHIMVEDARNKQG